MERGWNERSGGGAGGVGAWDKPVFRFAVRHGKAGSLARGRVAFYATGEHTSGVEASRRGVESVKFGCDYIGTKAEEIINAHNGNQDRNTGN